jgi:hypothetical protein
MAEHMNPGSCVYISSDSERGMNWMLQCFAGAMELFKPVSRDEVHARCNKNDNMFVINPKPLVGSSMVGSTSRAPAGVDECGSDDVHSEDGEGDKYEEREGVGAAEDATDSISWLAKYSEYMLSFNPLVSALKRLNRVL